MASPLINEIRGDWSNLKGTEYHLIYALWSLLRGGASRVMFYQGNDLLAHPAPPPILTQPNDELPVVPMQVADSEKDLWIQLKATKQPWTVSLLLKENLLSNFMFNALLSQQRKRAWGIQLITPARIQPEVNEFIAQPEQRPELYCRLGQIIAKVHQEWTSVLPGSDPVEESTLRDLALEILSQLAQTEPVSLRSLKAEVEAELAYAYPDREAVRQLANSLLGALLQDASAGPSVAHIYNIDWLNRAAGRPIKHRGPFDTDPIAACTESIMNALPHGWNSSYCIPRPQVENALQQFLGSPQSLFVLLGTSGTGKSWSVADWLTRVLANRTRLLVPGTDLDHWNTLDELIANRLRPFVSADWQDEVFVTRLMAASAKANDQVVIVIDDLKVPSGSIDVFHRDIARLVKFSKEKGIKLVITCQKQVWELYNLNAEILKEDIFLPDVHQIGIASPVSQQTKVDSSLREDQPYYSFVLSDFTLEELEDVLRRRLTPEKAERALILLRRSEFAALRNPFLLVLFLDKSNALHDASKEVFPNVDSLLDLRVEDSLSAIATKLSCSREDLQSAFRLLVQQLWELRPGGLTYAQAIDSLHTVLREQSNYVLAAMKQVGLLAPIGSIRIAEPLVAERLSAKLVGETLSSETAITEQLRPEEDAGVGRALLRGVVRDPIPLAESLLLKDERWREIVSDGLSQVSHSDYRILALISVLARPDVDGYMHLNMSEPLGRLATRDRRAWKWVTQMYMSGDDMERHRGEYALGTALEIDARLVEGALRLRLSQAKRKRPDRQWDEEKYFRWLRDAISPLAHIKNHESAQIGRRLLRRYDRTLHWKNAQSYQPLLEIIDEVQGQIALFGTKGDLETLLDELQSEDVETRFHRACALRLVAFQQPKTIQDALFDAIRKEENGNVLARLLIASHPLINIASSELLEAFEDSIAIRWDKPFLTSNALGILGPLADKHPQRVSNLLPKQLDSFEPVDQAWLSDALTYAWWHCAKYISECRDRLSDLAIPALKDLPEKYHPFALRGAATAQLASIAFDVAPSHQLPLLYSSGDRILYYVDATDLAQEHAPAFVRHPDYAKLQALLVSCINAEEQAGVHPVERLLYQEAFHCARLSLEYLIRFAFALDDPLPLLREVPRDWQALRAAWRLLKAGRREQSLVAFAREEYDAHKNSGSLQADHDMHMCLLQLARLDNDPQQLLEEQKPERRSFFFGASGEAQSLALLTDTNPTELLKLLNNTIKNDDSVTVLFNWEKETRSWRSLLLARVYTRMFSSTLIGVPEAQELCQQMLVGVGSLPDSPLRQEYEIVYTTILNWLRGGSPIPATKDSYDSAVQQSHSFALSLFPLALEKRTDGASPEWIEDVFSDRQGWLELDDYKYEDGNILGSTAGYLIYFFPAVRLALASIGKYYQLADPAGSFMQRRVESIKIINDYSMVFQNPLMSDRQLLGRALRDLQRRVRSVPGDERLWERCGNLLLRLGKMEAAEEALKRSLNLRLCDKSLRASALYDLACVYARTGREEECRLALVDSSQLRPLKKDWMQKDPDLESVRGRDWFKDLTEK